MLENIDKSPAAAVENEQILQREEQKPVETIKFNYELIDKKVLKELIKTDIDNQCKKVQLVKIPHSLYSGEDNQELNVNKNFVCQGCKNIPVAPIKVCTTCENLYCEFCAQSNPKCCFKKCRSMSLRTEPIGRIIRNIMDQFTIKHSEIDGLECKEEYTYPKFVEHLAKTCPQNKQLKCLNKDCSDQELMMRVDLEEHMEKNCSKILLQCIYCEDSFKKEVFMDHGCTEIIAEKLKQEATKLKAIKPEHEIETGKYKLENKKYNDIRVIYDQLRRDYREKDQEIRIQREQIRKFDRVKGNPEQQKQNQVFGTDNMIAYNLQDIATLTASHFDKGFEPENMLNDNPDCHWKVSESYGNGMLGWINIKLPRPMLMNGLEIHKKSEQVIPMTLFAKTLNDEKCTFDTGNQYQNEMMKDWKHLEFHPRPVANRNDQIARKELVENNLLVSEIKILIGESKEEGEAAKNQSTELFGIKLLM